VRTLRELFVLVLLFAAVGAGVFAVWSCWPRSCASSTGAQAEDTSLLARAEGRMRELIREQVVLDANRDPLVTQVTDGIQQRLARALGRAPYPIEVFVVDSTTVNAVCLPGGIILVYSGLIRRLQAPEELAAILAHESEHAVHRDAMQALKREMGISLLLSLAGGRQDALAGRLLKQMMSSGFSREQETSADQGALQALGASGIDPRALAQALRHIQPEPGDDLKLLQYLNTHPATGERIERAEAAAAVWTGKARPLDVRWTEFKGRFQFIR
jgi:beta-barrel assembly-enhancing protease